MEKACAFILKKVFRSDLKLIHPKSAQEEGIWNDHKISRSDIHVVINQVHYLCIIIPCIFSLFLVYYGSNFNQSVPVSEVFACIDIELSFKVKGPNDTNNAWVHLRLVPSSRYLGNILHVKFHIFRCNADYAILIWYGTFIITCTIFYESS